MNGGEAQGVRRTLPHESGVARRRPAGYARQALALATAVRKLRVSFSANSHHDKSVVAPYPALLPECKEATTLWW